MDAIIKKITISPVKRNKDNEITGPATALIMLEVPLDGIKQQQAVFDVVSIMNSDWIKVSISTSQMTLNLGVPSAQLDSMSGKPGEVSLSVTI